MFGGLRKSPNCNSPSPRRSLASMGHALYETLCVGVKTKRVRQRTRCLAGRTDSMSTEETSPKSAMATFALRRVAMGNMARPVYGETMRSVGKLTSRRRDASRRRQDHHCKVHLRYLSAKRRVSPIFTSATLSEMTVATLSKMSGSRRSASFKSALALAESPSVR